MTSQSSAECRTTDNRIVACIAGRGPPRYLIIGGSPIVTSEVTAVSSNSDPERCLLGEERS